MEIVLMTAALIIDIALYVLNFVIWWKIIDKVDVFLQEKLSGKSYFIFCMVVVILCIVLILFKLFN